MAPMARQCRILGRVLLGRATMATNKTVVEASMPGCAESDTARALLKVVPAPSPALKPPSSSAPLLPGSTTSGPIMVLAKMAAPGGVRSTAPQQQVTNTSGVQLGPSPAPGRTMVITVPRAAASAAAPQTMTVAPRVPQTTTTQLPANFQIPPGMMLIRSGSGQLMLVSQQAFAQVHQHAPRPSTGPPTPRLLTPPATPPTVKRNDKVTMIRMTAPPNFQTPPVQKMALETLENVKKCKDFLATLIKLASGNSGNMANNVQGLVKNLLEGKLEAEEFTEQLYRELKSTPQPCLVPFLKKSLPAVRIMTPNPLLFIQTALKTSNPPKSTTGTGKQLMPPPRPGPVASVAPKQTGLQSARNYTGTLPMRPFHEQPRQTPKSVSGSYKEDDDINDVASMAGVNLREENAQILTTQVGAVVQSCQDQPFLAPNALLARVLQMGQPLGVTEVGPEVVALVSHASQEYLRTLLEKMSVMAQHRKNLVKDDWLHSKVSDVRAQMKFLEDVETLKKKKKDEEERERLLRLARRRSHMEDPVMLQLKQKAKELQQLEQAALLQREANLAALAAIGPRRKRLDGQVSVLPRPDVPRVTRVIMRDLLQCMEQGRFLRHSLTLYRAMQ